MIPPAAWIWSASALTTGHAEGDRRHEVTVHHVDVDDPRAGRQHLVDLRAEFGEVRREDRRSDLELAE